MSFTPLGAGERGVGVSGVSGAYTTAAGAGDVADGDGDGAGIGGGVGVGAGDGRGGLAPSRLRLERNEMKDFPAAESVVGGGRG